MGWNQIKNKNLGEISNHNIYQLIKTKKRKRKTFFNKSYWLEKVELIYLKKKNNQATMEFQLQHKIPNSTQL